MNTSPKTPARIEDPVVAEVRKARAQMFAECGNDLHRLFGRMRRQEQSQPKAPGRLKRNPIARGTKL
jgi:hypothetical protein